MPETPNEMYDRVAGDLRMPPLDDWDSFPFEGELRLRTLRPPGPEPVREGEGGGATCSACTKPDSDYAWTSERWRLADPGPSGLPLIMLLEPREHYDAPSDLPEELAAEMGVMLGRVERAVLTLESVGRVHVGRWGEGAEHMHWWFIARPLGFTQLFSSFAEIWDSVLPPTPDDIWAENVARVVKALA